VYRCRIDPAVFADYRDAEFLQNRNARTTVEHCLRAVDVDVKGQRVLQAEAPNAGAQPLIFVRCKQWHAFCGGMSGKEVATLAGQRG
jgi:hypothetical protein